MFTSVYSLIAARILHGIGFGLSTTFDCSVADVIPAQRRGEGIGYLGLGIMAMAELALGVMLLTDFSANMLFFTSMIVTFLAAVSAKLCNAKEAPLPLYVKKHICLIVISCVNMVQEYLQY